VQLSSSDDAGKTWKQVAWGIDTWGTSGLQIIDKKATVSFGNSSAHTLLFPVDTLTDDPPAPMVIDATAVDAPCDAKAGHHRFTQYIVSARRPIHVTIDGGSSFSPSERVMHDAPGGKTCTSAYISTSYYTSKGYETAFVYPEVNGTFTGWRFRRPEDHNKTGMIAEPLTCK